MNLILVGSLSAGRLNREIAPSKSDETSAVGQRHIVVSVEPLATLLAEFGRSRNGVGSSPGSATNLGGREACGGGEQSGDQDNDHPS